MRSVPRARAYAQASGESSNPSISSTKQDFFSLSESFLPTAADVGLTCLKEVAATCPVLSFSSLTSCQLLNASRKLMYPGLPFRISMAGRNRPP